MAREIQVKTMTRAKLITRILNWMDHLAMFKNSKKTGMVRAPTCRCRVHLLLLCSRDMQATSSITSLWATGWKWRRQHLYYDLVLFSNLAKKRTLISTGLNWKGVNDIPILNFFYLFSPLLSFVIKSSLTL